MFVLRLVKLVSPWIHLHQLDLTMVLVLTGEPNQNRGQKTRTKLGRKFSSSKPNQNWALADPVSILCFKNRNCQFRFEPDFLALRTRRLLLNSNRTLGLGYGLEPSLKALQWSKTGLMEALPSWLAGPRLASNGPILDRWRPGGRQKAKVYSRFQRSNFGPLSPHFF